MHFTSFSYPLIIKEHHLDTFGHVNNATYLQLFEEARWEFIQARGFGLKDIQKSGLGPVILECHLRFLKELRLRQTIRIETQTLAYEKKIGQLKQVILNEQDEICCEVLMTFGLFDTHNRQLVLPTEAWFHAIGRES